MWYGEVWSQGNLDLLFHASHVVHLLGLPMVTCGYLQIEPFDFRQSSWLAASGLTLLSLHLALFVASVLSVTWFVPKWVAPLFSASTLNTIGRYDHFALSPAIPKAPLSCPHGRLLVPHPAPPKQDGSMGRGEHWVEAWASFSPNCP